MDVLIVGATIVGSLAALAGAAFGWRQLHPAGWAEERRRFKSIRHHLHGQRTRLGRLVAQRYPGGTPIDPRVPLLSRPEWLPDRPIPIASVRLVLNEDEKPASNVVKLLARSWPHSDDGERFPTYWEAVYSTDPPQLGSLFDADTYRLTLVDLREKPRLEFGMGRYADLLSSGEAVAFEAARADLRGRRIQDPKVKLRARDAVETWNLARRVVNVGISTLTIRDEGDQAGFLMHDRRPARIATAEGVLHVTPAGEFQPPACTRVDQAGSLNIWQNMMREYNEEYLGAEDASGPDAKPIDFDSYPYSSMEQFRKEGAVRPYLLGVGLDPLSLKGEILTVCVWDSEAFDLTFPGIHLGGAEGDILTGRVDHASLKGYAFTQDGVDSFIADRILPAGAACLALAWRWRHSILRAPRSRSVARR